MQDSDETISMSEFGDEGRSGEEEDIIELVDTVKFVSEETSTWIDSGEDAGQSLEGDIDFTQSMDIELGLASSSPLSDPEPEPLPFESIEIESSDGEEILLVDMVEYLPPEPSIEATATETENALTDVIPDSDEEVDIDQLAFEPPKTEPASETMDPDDARQAIDPEHVERIITQVVRDMAAEKIDLILGPAIEEAIEREIKKIKDALTG